MLYSFLRKLVWVFYHVTHRVMVFGGENIPKQKGGYIIASNHVSNNDPPVVGITFGGKYGFMAKDELFHINPIFTWLITHLGAFPVKRGAKDSTAIDNALKCLDAGRILVIFPEGTRSKDGELGKAKSGVTIIAARAKVPVVPVFIKYGKKGLRRKIIVMIGEAIPADRLSVSLEDKRTLKAANSELMSRIAALKEKAPDAD